MVYSTRRFVVCLSCVILFLCFSVLLVLRLPRLGKRELILVLFIRLFCLCLFRFVGFLFLLGSGKGCGLWLWHSLDFSLTFFLVFWHAVDKLFKFRMRIIVLAVPPICILSALFKVWFHVESRYNWVERWGQGLRPGKSTLYSTRSLSITGCSNSILLFWLFVVRCSVRQNYFFFVLCMWLYKVGTASPLICERVLTRYITMLYPFYWFQCKYLLFSVLDYWQSWKQICLEMTLGRHTC